MAVVHQPGQVGGMPLSMEAFERLANLTDGLDDVVRQIAEGFAVERATLSKSPEHIRIEDVDVIHAGKIVQSAIERLIVEGQIPGRVDVQLHVIDDSLCSK
ncbi:hypothetical protein [Planctopirus hydrillae]|uniref:Uncharacterized protein n=1 Tax=Planctopirus hydrillae TaxID=1841610 RepID=A0A1C3E9S8_9PLAN|nr:hypothetical protein [Planctopirus hydrillae]ODA29988.1 hypothetical protein A6X21_06515 [Planctopirus hydrillae]